LLIKLFKKEIKMPQFSDDIFLGTAQSFVGVNTASNLGDPSPMDLGFGPMGRSYIYDITPAATSVAGILAAKTPTGATTYSGSQLATASATNGTTSVTRTDGTVVLQLDYPRALSCTTASGSPTNSVITISGWDYYGQAMTEIIQSGTVASTTTNGRKAFFQVSSIAFSAATTVAVSIGVTKVMGLPAKITDFGYLIGLNTNNTIARDTGTATTGYSGGNLYYGIQAISAFTAASPSVITVPYSPPSGTLIQFTGSVGSLTGVSLNTTYWWTNASGTTGNISTSQANYLAGTKVAAGGSYGGSGLNLTTVATSSAVTPDVRGTYTPSSTPDGVQRTLITIGLTGIQVGPNATRAGLLGIDQA
jgi:hypothetical protein